MKLKSIEISGMRSIVNAKLELDGLTVLIGENGSGKSTILEALEIFQVKCVGTWSWASKRHFPRTLHLRRSPSSSWLGCEPE